MADRMETIRISIARTDTPMIAAIIIMSLFEPVGTVDCVDSVVGLSLATAYSIIIKNDNDNKYVFNCTESQTSGVSIH